MHINIISSLSLEERDKLSKVMREFNFCEILRCMKKVNWKWGVKVPTLYELMSEAEKLLIEALNTLRIYESGGFRAEYKNNVLSLSFNIDYKES